MEAIACLNDCFADKADVRPKTALQEQDALRRLPPLKTIYLCPSNCTTCD